jgi:hypothetical protein
MRATSTSSCQHRRSKDHSGCARRFDPPFLHARGSFNLLVIQVTRDAVSTIFLGAGVTVRSAATAAEQQPLLRSHCDLAVQSIVQGTSPDSDARPWVASGFQSLFMSVTMHSCAHMLGQHCHSSAITNAIATGNGRNYACTIHDEYIIDGRNGPGGTLRSGRPCQCVACGCCSLPAAGNVRHWQLAR